MTAVFGQRAAAGLLLQFSRLSKGAECSKDSGWRASPVRTDQLASALGKIRGSARVATAHAAYMQGSPTGTWAASWT